MARRYFISHRVPFRSEEHKILHKNDTPILRELALKLYELEFTREHTFVYDHAGSRYRLDFAQLDYKVNVEFDGANHVRRAALDAKRDARLVSRGWRVVRVVFSPTATATSRAGWSLVWQPNEQPTPFTRQLQAVLRLLFP